jgi:hypothetical protein
VHLERASIPAFKYISKFIQSVYDETAELSLHLKGIREKEQFWLEEHRKRF